MDADNQAMKGVVVLAVRPVWGGAAEGAEAVDSVSY